MIEAFVVAMLAAPAAPPAPGIGAFRMHLFYENSGRLSKDISPPVKFTGWNTVIGEGSAEEAANDLLVTVEVKGPPGEAIEQPLILVARAKGKVLAQRRFDSLLTNVQGRTYKALWLSDVGCAGRIEIVATIGRSTRKTAISLDCGE
ncbi:MAG TPA: hypothetical protein VFQ67_13555 [Allosphingosinicella sp.]|nr:hypothetical protein [Allosphingosinicella sp.]